ncbi:MAG: hypothetical protein HOV83_13395 [Catenulispora sp.]|nr:hypothetical protein [Catenulispora sp.]
MATGLGVVTGLASAVTAPAHASVAVPGAANGSLYYFKYGYSTSIEYHSVSETGTEDHGVTLPRRPDQGMAWSADGRRMAIASDDGVLGIYNADGSTVAVLTPPSSTVRYTKPRFLPDDSIAFIREDTTVLPGLFRIFSAHADGTGVALVPVPGAAGDAIFQFDVDQNGTFYFRDESTAPAYRFVSWHRGDATVSQVVPGTAAAPGAGQVAVSPDGSKLAVQFSDPAHPAVKALALVDLATHATHSIDSSAAFQEMAFSPDGKKLAYSKLDATTGVTSDHAVVLDLATGTVATLAAPSSEGHFSSPMAWRPQTRVQVDRVAGEERIGTSIATSQLAFNDHGKGGRQAGAAVLSRSDLFADALAGGALAAHKNGPLLLTGTAHLDPAVKAELQRVLTPGATVYLLGGTSALSDHVFSEVAGLGFIPKRIKGDDRYQTATAIAQVSAPTPHVFLVGTGVNFPDALAAGAVAGANSDAVVLLSSDRTLPATTRDYLAAHYHTGDILLGVGAQGSDALKTLYPTLPMTSQLRGVDRFDTAAKLANFFYSGPYPPRTVGLAVGSNWPDALGGGALLGAHPGPLLLTDGSGTPGSEHAYLSANSGAVKEIVVFGGTHVVPDAVVSAVANAIAGAGKWDGHVNRAEPALP